MTRRAAALARAGALAALVAAIPPLHERALAGRSPRQGDPQLYLWSGRHVRLLFPGFHNLAADVYWLRTVQYYGGQRAFSRDKTFPLLRPLVEITTTLDPRFEIAYRYGAVFLAEPRPMGAGDPAGAVELLEKGVAALPDDWRLRQWLGFFHYSYRDDARQAAEVLTEASKLEGAPFWLRTLAGSFLAAGGERELSRRLWTEMYNQSEEGLLRENARGHLRYLEALDAADAIAGSVARFQRQHGRWPRSLGELREAGLLPDPPLDPEGVPFAYDPETGKVEIARQSPLWRPLQAG